MASRHLQRVLENKSQAYKESVKKDTRDHGYERPLEAQVGTRTWKSYSKIRVPSQAFREGWDRVFS